jgi:UDPglucose 6-dehydrogenase
VEEAAGGSVAGKTIALWGLSFKARTDDLRESPSLEIAAMLIAAGATVQGYDPTVHADLNGITVTADPYAATEGADVLLVGTEWDEFRWLDIDKVASVMNGKAVVDARNLLDGAALKRAGFSYVGIGRS